MARLMSPAPAVNARTERMLAAPIAPTLARLSAPGVLLVAFQSLVSVGDTYFVGRLGTGPLAGLALVFPLLMLLQMTSAGAMGGGVSSAIARALGSGDAAAARRFVVHALVIAAAMGAAFTVLISLLGQWIYGLLGGQGETLEHALRYSSIVFGGAIVVWIANTLSSVLRGSGNMLTPALTLIGAALVHLPLSGILVSRIGIAGAGIAYVTTFGIASLVMALIVQRSSLLSPRRADWRLEWRLFREILRVGAISTLSAVQTVLTAVILTGFVGRHGAAALAGYGVGLRLELLQIPLVFAVGQALVVLVGTHMGAGRAARAKRIAWVGAGFAACISLVIGVAVSIFPLAWVGLFSSDAAVLEHGSSYLRTVAPFYPLLAAGIALYFASQGAGRVLRPILAGTARLAIVIAGGLMVASLQGVFVVIAFAMIAFGALTVWFVASTDWK
ncbi:MAG TPA: MATE family efflux transporter [Burkholderiales bacterium]|nr:MATE family efflux transporter [Burkholderiales bacterium]